MAENIDGCHRVIDYLRISVTDRCNLRCRYCMPECIESVPMSDLLTYEEIEQIVRAAAEFGIRHIRLTGGEPLVRKGCSDLAGRLKQISGIETVMLTTNGILLRENLDALQKAGISGINISLDTLNREAYKNITGKDGMQEVLLAIQESVKSGIKTKINVTVSNAISIEETVRVAELAEQMPVDVRFIEMMPIGYGRDFAGISNIEVLDELKKRWPDLSPDQTGHGFGPAVYWKSQAMQGSVGFISAIHNKFCKNCNRLRLTSTGQLKYCLCYEDGEDLRKLVREEAGSGALVQAFERAVKRKPVEHHFENWKEISETRKMNQIGG